MFRSRAFLVVAFGTLLLQRAALAASVKPNKKDPCRKYTTQLACRAASCIWEQSQDPNVSPLRDPPCRTPKTSQIEPILPTGGSVNEVGALPTPKEQLDCSNPTSCDLDDDCCLGFVCRDADTGISQTKNKNNKAQPEKQCVSPEPPPPAIDCPPVGSSMDIIGGNYLLKTYSDLCTLTMITSNKNGEVVAVVPLARTYLGHNWEVAAGSYASTNVFTDEIPCSNGICSVILPPLQNQRATYRLSSYVRTLDELEKRARFLEMATFGTTPQDLTSDWDLENEAEWVQRQMELPLTSHREYFRKRANPKWMFSQKVGRSNHPCDENSRWRSFAFSRKDKFRVDGGASGYLYVQNMTYFTNANGKDVPSGPYILNIDGHARTVVETWRWKMEQIHETFPTWDSNYAYEFCSSPDEWTGGSVYLQTKPFEGYPDGYCREIRGNPKINFTGFEMLMGPHVLNLSKDDIMVSIDQWKDGGTKRFDDQYILPNGINGNDLCDVIPSQSEDFAKPVFAIHPTKGLLIWEPRLILEENTLDSPLTDGGGATEKETNGKTFCSNVPRTFLNFDDCVFNSETTACGAAAAADTTIDLKGNTLLNLHKLTGRYVYAIHGLKVKQEEFGYEVDHPCTPGVRSRWEREPGTTCDKPTLLKETTRKTLRQLIAVSSDDNPFIRDVTFPRNPGVVCDDRDTNVEIDIQVGSDCWKHVHPEHLSIWDVTYWTRPNTHPGNKVAANAGRSNPITKWLDGGLPVMVYPTNHPMDATLHHDMSRWDENFGKFEYIGRFGDSLNYRDLPSNLQTEAVAEFYGAAVSITEKGVLICGSPGEVANDETMGDNFDVASDFFRDTTPRSILSRQREIVWTMVALYGKDQLRQRMAWALSQILVIAKSSISLEGKDTEINLQFYDIFVRNAFGNYLDVLREISFSPLMAENLSYLNSRSSAYVLEKYVRHEYADENFAREIMQLFSTGLVLLNTDGTPKLDEKNKIQEVYTNADIRSFARAWTGFARQAERGNYEDVDNSNRLDPLKIFPQWRDRFPKTDLYGGYIGDQYPLCVDLPPKQFLRKGAKYRFLGRSPLPELQYDYPQYTERFTLNGTASSLFFELCNDQGGKCRFQNQVTLDRNLNCNGLECNVDTVRVVEVTSGMFYEYVQPPCVEHPFYDNAMKLNKATKRRRPVCGNPLLPIATSACCEESDSYTEAVSKNLYQVERMTFATQDARCTAVGRTSCEYDHADIDAEYWENDLVYRWAFAPCSIQIKVNPQGEAAIVHNVSIDSVGKVLHVNDDSRNYFGVRWNDDLYPRQSGDDCGICERVEGVNCLCDTSVEEKVVFTGDPESAKVILKTLNIGAPDPSSFDTGTYSSTNVNDFIVHRRGNSYSRSTIFEVEDKDTGRTLFLKNVESTVFLANRSGERSGLSFRNPVHFMSLVPPEATVRDAMYETEATLEHYFYHDNTAPFLCIRFIQRFGISNASPRYVKSCATAFRQGTYQSRGIKFGNGKYGDLAATAAAVVLDREARSVVLDADPAFGSIREPLIRVIGLMRGMDFQMKDSGRKGETPLAVFRDLDQFIGQMAHEHTSVFSFFLPEFQPEGPVSSASLVAPEAQMLDMPKQIDLINGVHSMIKYGLSHCYYDASTERQFGFGEVSDPPVGFGGCRDNGRFSRATGLFTYEPKGESSEEIVDEIATILTSGRLSTENRRLIAAAFDAAVVDEDAAAGLRIAQQLITVTPEFHTTSTVKLSGESLPEVLPPPPSDKDYKAVIFLMLAGGCDSFNMLVPNQCSAIDDGVDAYTHYAEIRNPAHLLPEKLLPIDGSGQANCDTFGVHEELPIVQELYNDGDLLFFANTGVLGKPSTKSTFRYNTPTQLFAHNTMQFETRAVDLFNKASGTGVLGRLTDALGKIGLSTGSVALDATSSILAGVPGKSPAPYVVSQNGVRQFMPQDASTMSRAEMMIAIEHLNNATTDDSAFMAKTWSNSLIQSLFQNEELHAALEGAEVTSDFGATELGRKFEIVSKMIQTRHTRGTDIDVFFVEIGGFDTHADVELNLKQRFRTVNSGVRGVVNELKSMNLWDNVVLIQASEFGRTLSPNSGSGTDHAWGGNYFMSGGSVKGGRILGKYPTDMSDESEINVGRGRLIPTTSWDQIWPGISQWTGVMAAEDFDNICPNRGNFDSVFSAFDLFENVPQDPIPEPLPEGQEETPPPGEGASENPDGTSTSGPLLCMTVALILPVLSLFVMNWI